MIRLPRRGRPAPAEQPTLSLDKAELARLRNERDVLATNLCVITAERDRYHDERDSGRAIIVGIALACEADCMHAKANVELEANVTKYRRLLDEERDRAAKCTHAAEVADLREQLKLLRGERDTIFNENGDLSDELQELKTELHRARTERDKARNHSTNGCAHAGLAAERLVQLVAMQDVQDGLQAANMAYGKRDLKPTSAAEVPSVQAAMRAAKVPGRRLGRSNKATPGPRGRAFACQAALRKLWHPHH